jgi:hypothetical protein
MGQHSLSSGQGSLIFKQIGEPERVHDPRNDRSRQLKSVGKIGLLPSLFNINEPILFGFPVIMNPRWPTMQHPAVRALTMTALQRPCRGYPFASNTRLYFQRMDALSSIL